MPTRPRFAWFEGRIVPFSEARVPLDDRGLQFSESVYEVVAIAAGKPRLLEEHVHRMERAAPEVGLAGAIPRLAEWERMSYELARLESVSEALLYAQLTGGAAGRDYVPERAPEPAFFAYVTPHRFPREPDVERGLSAISLDDARWARRDLKTTMLLPAVLAKREASRRGADEAILVGQGGIVHEGASSNVFAVERGVLVTPVQSAALLPGTTRGFVARVASEAGLEVRNEAIAIERLRAADEVFVTSSSRLVMPVVSLDGRTIGAGRAGPVALDLSRRARRMFEIVE